MKSYVDRQNEWLANNILKEGDEVIITRTAYSGEEGWEDCWSGEMDKFVNLEGCKFHSITSYEFGLRITVPLVSKPRSFYTSTSYNFPFFVLKPKSKSKFTLEIM